MGGKTGASQSEALKEAAPPLKWPLSTGGWNEVRAAPGEMLTNE